MDLDRRAFERARRSRDPRFDGRFFIGVKTTGIYCRPVCPAPSPKERNVVYFPSAAAAAEAGFRPCLRCRPESSPGTPAWLGTSSTVSRALRLMAETALDGAGVEALAGRLGIGSRHLRRLFLEHLGATPVAVAQTRRVHFAKKLIDETALPFTEVAVASGFGSIRRFNAAFRKLYGRTPTELRRLARRIGAAPRVDSVRPGERDARHNGGRPRAGEVAPTPSRGNGASQSGGQRFRATSPGDYRFRLGFRPPFDWNGLLEFVAPRAIPGVEAVDRGCYRRTIALGEHAGYLEARLGRDAVDLSIHFPDPRGLVSIVERVRRLFDLGADPAQIRAHLGHDPALKRRVARRPGLRVPGAWDGFELAVRAILGQQVTVAGATTLSGRIVKAFGHPFSEAPGLTHLFPTPAALAAADFSAIGLPRARAETLRHLARAVLSGEIAFSGVGDAGAFSERFQRLSGVGPWTAQYVAMRALGEPDAFPAGDLGLLRATGLGNSKELERRAEAWRPWRAYAAMHLWQGGTSNGRDLLHPRRKPGRTAAAHRR